MTNSWWSRVIFLVFSSSLRFHVYFFNGCFGRGILSQFYRHTLYWMKLPLLKMCQWKVFFAIFRKNLSFDICLISFKMLWQKSSDALQCHFYDFLINFNFRRVGNELKRKLWFLKRFSVLWHAVGCLSVNEIDVSFHFISNCQFNEQNYSVKFDDPTWKYSSSFLIPNNYI